MERFLKRNLLSRSLEIFRPVEPRTPDQRKFLASISLNRDVRSDGSRNASFCADFDPRKNSTLVPTLLIKTPSLSSVRENQVYNFQSPQVLVETKMKHRETLFGGNAPAG